MQIGINTTYTYYDDGNVFKRTDGNSNIITYGYDSLGRLTSKTYPDSTTANFQYDTNGRLIHADNDNIIYDFTYDGAGRVTTVTDSRGVSVDNTYSLAGRRTKMKATLNGVILLEINYEYDSRGRLLKTIPVGYETTPFEFAYDGANRRTSLTYPNGSSAAYGYDERGRQALIPDA